MRKTCFMVVFMLSFLGLKNEAGALSVGDAAPDVSASDQNGATVRLADLYAQGPVLVFFYPKAGTPGCTAQACSLRDAFPDFEATGVRIVGVSGDSVEGQKNFAEKNNLPFTLLADTESVVAKAFGVPVIPLVGAPKRQSFIVRDGKIAWVVQSAQTGQHAAEVRAALAELGLAEKS
jgi:peroxiredoxin Q/BCP